MTSYQWLSLPTTTNNKQYLSTGESLLINPGRYSNISGKELGSLERALEADEVLLTEKNKWSNKKECRQKNEGNLLSVKRET